MRDLVAQMKPHEYFSCSIIWETVIWIYYGTFWQFACQLANLLNQQRWSKGTEHHKCCQNAKISQQVYMHGICLFWISLLHAFILFKQIICSHLKHSISNAEILFPKTNYLISPLHQLCLCYNQMSWSFLVGIDTRRKLWKMSQTLITFGLDKFHVDNLIRLRHVTRLPWPCDVCKIEVC